jgi:transcriptional regulator with XRE-family HTH domain/mannose-6-phosphate isomerase-like protein (cupin superfamily)
MFSKFENVESEQAQAESPRTSSTASPENGTEGGGSGRDVLPTPVGERLRAHRKEAGLSLRGLAREVGVSPSLISQIEHGKATPSVGTLYGIVSRLDISMDELFFDAPRGAAAVAARDGEESSPSAEDTHPGLSSGTNHWQAPSEGPVLRADNRLSLTLASDVRWERLTASHDPGVEFLYVTYPVGGESCPEDALMQHAGSEYGLVLSGRLGATVGAGSYVLEPGDSIAFDSPTPHRFWAIGEEPAIAVWTVVGRLDDPRVG